MAEEDDERPPGEEDPEDLSPPGETPSESKTSVVVDPTTNGAASENVEHPKEDAVKQGDVKAEDKAFDQVEQEPASADPIPDPAVTSAETATTVAPADPYAGYTGYDPAAAGYDYSAYWAQYGYQGTSYPGYYTGYEAYYDPNAYQAYAQPAASVPPPQPPSGPPPTATPLTPGTTDAVPGDETDAKEEKKDNEETVQRSTAEEEERRRAEEERVRAAQAAAEEATRAAAEEASRQAAEQQRLAEEAAVRAHNLAAQRASAEQAHQGPSPEVLARIQKELAEAQALATRKKAEKELAAAAAAKAIAEAEATAAAGPAALQGASKKKPVVAKNIMLKGARMAFHGTGQASKVPLNKVFEDTAPKPSATPPLQSKTSDKLKSEKSAKLYMPEPLARANRMPAKKKSPSPQRRYSQSPSNSQSPTYDSRSRSRSRSGGPWSGRPHGTSRRLGSYRSRSRLSRSASPPNSRSRSPVQRRRSSSLTPPRRFVPATRHSPSPAPLQRERVIRGNGRQYRSDKQGTPAQAVITLRPQISQERYVPLISPDTRPPEQAAEDSSLSKKARRKEKKKHKRHHREISNQSPGAQPDNQETRHRQKRKKNLQPDYDEEELQLAHDIIVPEAPPVLVAKVRPIEPVVSRALQKHYSVPSPPRIADLRRKYGIAISASGHSPTYSSTPSPSPPPVRAPQTTAPKAVPRPAPAPARPVQAALHVSAAPIRLPAQVKEAAEALAIKAQKQEVQAKQEPPALRERTTDQPVIGKETGRASKAEVVLPIRRERGPAMDVNTSRQQSGGRRFARSPIVSKRRSQGLDQRRRFARRSYSRERSSPRRRSRSRRPAGNRRSRSLSRSYSSRSLSSRSPSSGSKSRRSSSDYSSMSRSRSRSRLRSRRRSSYSSSRSRSRSVTPERIKRARSPVIPMRMRMDEEMPVNDVQKATQAARRAATKISTEANRRVPELPVSAVPAIVIKAAVDSDSRPSSVADVKPVAVPAKPQAETEAAISKSRVLRLANMLERDDLLDDEEYNENVEDITQEVEKKYGKLTSIEAPRPSKSGSDPPAVGLVFLAFENEKSAQKAQLALNGRKYGENTIRSSFYDEGKFVRKQLA